MRLEVRDARKIRAREGDTLRVSLSRFPFFPANNYQAPAAQFTPPLVFVIQGSKLKKSSGRLLATNWRNIVARCKFLVAGFYNVNDAAQGL